jgi:cobalt/nickel transport protein
MVGLIAVSLVLPRSGGSGEAFTGTDDQAQSMIQELRPGYVPWFASVWEPPSGEVETLLFTMQAAVGAAILGYVLGYFRGRATGAGRADERA